MQRHIEALLLENECVIVPDFGGFMTHHVSAHYEQDDHSFLPPQRTLGFNPQLRMNDSVLVHSYVEAYDISYPEALRRIESEVSKVRQQLSENGSYTMDNLGTLTVNQEGNYEFTPCEAGVLSPELYGLGRFTFKQLKDAETVETIELPKQDVSTEGEPASPLLEFTDSDDDSAISIKLSWIRNAVAVAAAVVAFFLIATPVTNSNMANQTMSRLQNNILFKMLPSDTNTIPAEPTTIAAKAEAKEAKTVAKRQSSDVLQQEVEAVSAQESSAETAQQVVARPYCIVLASQVKKSNAESYVAQLHKDGYSDARVYIHHNIVRVVCGEYQTEGEAYRQLNKMNAHSGFEEAWVYKMKE